LQPHRRYPRKPSTIDVAVMVTVGPSITVAAIVVDMAAAVWPVA
jgi:hypothetical protein